MPARPSNKYLSHAIKRGACGIADRGFGATLCGEGYTSYLVGDRNDAGRGPAALAAVY